MRPIGLVIPLVVLGCMCAGGDPPSPGIPAVDVPAAAGTDGWSLTGPTTHLPGGTSHGVEYAALESVVASTPPEFTLPIPVIAGGPWPDAAPPRAWLNARLCAGDAELWDRVDHSLASAKAAGPPIAAEETYSGLLAYCDDPGFCRFAADRHRAGEPSRLLADLALAHCREPDTDALLLEPGTSPVALVLRLQGYDRPPSDNLLRAAATALPTVVAGLDAFGVRQAVNTLRILPDPAISAGLKAALPLVTDAQTKETLAIGLARQTDPEAQAIFASVCDVASPPAGCERAHDNPPPAPDACAGTEWETGDGWQIDQCLPALAARDWAAAQRVARRPAATESAGGKVLLRYESAGAWLTDLRDSGVLVGPTPTASPLPLDVRTLLVDAGQAAWFDVETGQWPNEHEGLLTKLAALAPGGLGDVAFGEAAPPVEGMRAKHPSPAGSYQLFAWMDGHRFAVRAEDLGDWYDLPAVLGLLNSLARQRNVDTSWVTLATGGQDVVVVALTARGLEAARTQGWLTPGEANDAATAGKGFEEQVFQELSTDGADVKRDVVIPN